MVHDRVDGYVDTNVFVHAFSRDHHSEECRAFVRAIEAGTLTVVLDDTVMLELSIVVQRVARQLTRAEVASYLRSILLWPGVRANIDSLLPAIDRWANTPGLDFTDALIGARASAAGVSIFTKNVKDYRDFGVPVPAPLPR